MANTDYEWLTARLDTLGYTDPTLVKAVLEVCYTLDAHDLNPTERKAVADLLLSVVESRFHQETPTESAWVPFNTGVTRPGDTVRIKVDAYEGAAGERHNGLVGTIVGIRGGRVNVQYIGRNDGTGHSHLPSALEVLDKASSVV